MTRKVALTRGQFALVDDEEFDRINSYRWFSNATRIRRGSDRPRRGKRRERVTSRLKRSLSCILELNANRILYGHADIGTLLIGEQLDQIDLEGGRKRLGNSAHRITENKRLSTNKQRNKNWRYSLDRLTRRLGRYSIPEQIETWETEGGSCGNS